MSEGLKFNRRRRSRSEAARLVSEYEQSGLGRREFCMLHGLSVATLDAWRQRQRQLATADALVPVEIIEAGAAPIGASKCAAQRQGYRILLPSGLGIELEAGFDSSELRRLVTALAGV